METYKSLDKSCEDENSLYSCKLRVELSHPEAKMPRKANPSDACFDLYLPENVEVAPGETVSLNLGICIELEQGWEAQIRGRSGLAKRGFWVHNGTIDHLYRQNLWIIAHNLSSQNFSFKSGDRIAQLKVSRVWPVELVQAKVEKSERGGLGSTGR